MQRIDWRMIKLSTFRKRAESRVDITHLIQDLTKLLHSLSFFPFVRNDFSFSFNLWSVVTLFVLHFMNENEKLNHKQFFTFKA